MTIDIRQPELEALIQQRMASGRFQSIEDLLKQTLSGSLVPEASDDERPRKTGLELLEAIQAMPRKEVDLHPSSREPGSVGSNGVPDPKAAAATGERIYRERYQAVFEREYPEQFVAIDVDSQEAYRSTTAEGALEKAQAAAPGAFFYLMRVGHTGAFRVSYSQDPSLDWIFR